VKTVKINNIQRTGAVNPYRNQQDNKADNTQGVKGNKKDEVQISSEAKKLLGAQNTEFVKREEKIQELKQAVSTGTYHVEANQIAEKILPYLR
jgi:negative regulator of flagellin synthesis FlgM